MRPFNLSLAAKAAAILCAAALFSGCSKNDSSAPNVPVTGPTFNFTFPQTGTSHELQVDDVGTWGYACSPHGSGGMTGTIEVVAAAADSQLVEVGLSNGFTFTPQTATIKPGGKIRWVNRSTITFNHTATR